MPLTLESVEADVETFLLADPLRVEEFIQKIRDGSKKKYAKSKGLNLDGDVFADDFFVEAIQTPDNAELVIQSVQTILAKKTEEERLKILRRWSDNPEILSLLADYTALIEPKNVRDSYSVLSELLKVEDSQGNKKFEEYLRKIEQQYPLTHKQYPLTHNMLSYDLLLTALNTENTIQTDIEKYLLFQPPNVEEFLCQMRLLTSKNKKMTADVYAKVVIEAIQTLLEKKTTDERSAIFQSWSDEPKILIFLASCAALIKLKDVPNRNYSVLSELVNFKDSQNNKKFEEYLRKIEQQYPLTHSNLSSTLLPSSPPVDISNTIRELRDTILNPEVKDKNNTLKALLEPFYTGNSARLPDPLKKSITLDLRGNNTQYFKKESHVNIKRKLETENNTNSSIEPDISENNLIPKKLKFDEDDEDDKEVKFFDETKYIKNFFQDKDIDPEIFISKIEGMNENFLSAFINDDELLWALAASAASVKPREKESCSVLYKLLDMRNKNGVKRFHQFLNQIEKEYPNTRRNLSSHVLSATNNNIEEPAPEIQKTVFYNGYPQLDFNTQRVQRCYWLDGSIPSELLKQKFPDVLDDLTKDKISVDDFKTILEIIGYHSDKVQGTKNFLTEILQQNFPAVLDNLTEDKISVDDFKQILKIIDYHIGKIQGTKNFLTEILQQNLYRVLKNITNKKLSVDDFKKILRIIDDRISNGQETTMLKQNLYPVLNNLATGQSKACDFNLILLRIKYHINKDQETHQKFFLEMLEQNFSTALCNLTNEKLTANGFKEIWGKIDHYIGKCEETKEFLATMLAKNFHLILKNLAGNKLSVDDFGQMLEKIDYKGKNQEIHDLLEKELEKKLEKEPEKKNLTLFVDLFANEEIKVDDFQQILEKIDNDQDSQKRLLEDMNNKLALTNYKKEDDPEYDNSIGLSNANRRDQDLRAAQKKQKNDSRNQRTDNILQKIDANKQISELLTKYLCSVSEGKSTSYDVFLRLLKIGKQFEQLLIEKTIDNVAKENSIAKNIIARSPTTLKKLDAVMKKAEKYGYQRNQEVSKNTSTPDKSITIDGIIEDLKKRKKEVSGASSLFQNWDTSRKKAAAYKKLITTLTSSYEAHELQQSLTDPANKELRKKVYNNIYDWMHEKSDSENLNSKTNFELMSDHRLVNDNSFTKSKTLFMGLDAGLKDREEKEKEASTSTNSQDNRV